MIFRESIMKKSAQFYFTAKFKVLHGWQQAIRYHHGACRQLQRKEGLRSGLEKDFRSEERLGHR